MFLSVIIPVYNCEQYVGACLKSLQKQQSQDFEVLVIDDGSSDKSAQICATFQDSDPRFRLFVVNENRGVSAARNIGIENARGDYLTFMDSDDLWDGTNVIGMLQTYAAKNEFPDTLCYDIGEYWSTSANKSFPDQDSAIQDYVRVSDFQSSIEYMLKRGIYYSSSTAKIVKRDIVIKNNLKFLEGCASNEDSDWSCQLLSSINSIIWVPQPFYLWRRRSDTSQSSKNISPKMLKDISDVIDRNIEASAELDDFRKRISRAFLAYIYVLFMGWSSYGHENMFRDAQQRQKANAWILDYGLSRRVEYVRRIYKVIGYNLTGKMVASVLKMESRRVDKSAAK